ncbi:MAG: SufS family cysteine desulfurase [Isosphaeraceae bacterium]
MTNPTAAATTELSRRAPAPGAAAALDFPPLGQELRPGVRLAYLDSAATALKPRPVIDAVRGYMEEYPANVHRGLHELSERASEAYEQARETVAAFLGAADSSEIVFTRGTTESINLVAQSWGRANLQPGDEILVTLLEHHSNLVPWQMVARETGATVQFAAITDDGLVDEDDFHQKLSARTKLVALTGMSNVLGTIPPVKRLVDAAKAVGALVMLDGAQSVPHGFTNVRALGVDFLALSAHKLYGPTGAGALYGRRKLLKAMPPWMGGGGMILRVGVKGPEWNEIPWKFEAGTPPIAEVIGFGAAVEYFQQFDVDTLVAHERALTAEAHRQLEALPGVTILGPGVDQKGGIVGFTVDTVHPHDLAQLLDRDGVAIRAGHHCAMPLHERLGVSASARASFGLYNTMDDVAALARSVERAIELFATKHPGR